jgi:hypothetical protein
MFSIRRPPETGIIQHSDLDSSPIYAFYFNHAGYVMFNGRIVVSDELKWMWKEVAETCFKVSSNHVPECYEENSETLSQDS